MRVFLTGGTGFVGQYILAELLGREHKVWALYRNESKRLETELFLAAEHCDTGKGALSWLAGDIQDVDTLWDRWLRDDPGLEEADTVIHCAASLRFSANDSGEPFATNLKGAEALHRLVTRRPMQAHLLSTAYVCGYVGRDVVREEFHTRVTFNNEYEESKWQAERLWQGHATLLRPSVVVGDSRTGRCTSFLGWYIPVRALQRLDTLLQTSPSMDRSSFEINVPADPLSSINIVPVDYVACAAVAIIENPANHNRIFHITHPEPITYEWNQVVLSKRFNLGGIKFIGQNAPLPPARNEFHAFLLARAQPILKYFSNAPRFDRTNTYNAVSHLRVPSVDERYLNLLIDYGIETDWGGRSGSV